MVLAGKNLGRPLFVRADAKTRMGTGHVMRCIALAQAWKDAGGEVTFLSHCESEALRRRILDEGFGLIPVEDAHPDPADLRRTMESLRKAGSVAAGTWIVIDGYHFDSGYQEAIREAGFKSLVIDDTAHLGAYHADILLNQNIHAPDLDYSCDRDTLLLMGCEYALLRREFLEYAGKAREIAVRARKILVTLGGGDPDNATLKVLKALNGLGEAGLEVRIVVGPANPHRESLEAELRRSPPAFSLLESARNMPEMMQWADFAVSAGGSTCWELAFMGLPFMTLVLADNQADISRVLGERGVSLDLGWHADLEPESLARALAGMIGDQGMRHRFSAKGQDLVKGRGSRIAGEMMSGVVA